MKSLEELAWTTGDLPSLLTQVILAEVEEAARARRFGRNLVRINEDLVRTKGRQLVLYTRGTLIATAVSEGGSATQSTISYTPTTLDVNKYGVTAKITQEAIDGSNLDLIKDTIYEAGIALADKEDLVIVDKLIGRSTIVAGAVDTQLWGGMSTFGHSPVLEVALASGSTFTILDMDYYSGILKVSPTTTGKVTFSYYYTDSTNINDALGAGTLTYEDIMDASAVIRSNKWSPDFMLIHPNQMNDLLKASTFTDFSKYGAREPLLRGEIGQISGMRVLVSTNMPDGNALLITSKRAAWLAIKRPIDLKRDDSPSTDSIDLYFFMEYGCTVYDAQAMCLIVNLKSDAGAL